MFRINLFQRQVFLYPALFLIILFQCSPNKSHDDPYPAVKIVGAMKDVMWNGQLGAKVSLDTIKNKKGLYGLGPEEYLTGELIIIDGKSYRSTVVTDSSMKVQETFDAHAPFFGYGNVLKWDEVALPDSVRSLSQLENLLALLTPKRSTPFLFTLKGNIESGIIHVQNLPEGTVVNSPQDAHQGQTNYPLEPQEVDIVGFFSMQHRGIFTHHDTFMHLHLITSDRNKMGHLDAVTFATGMRLFLPLR